jgi:predicted ATP-dependent endonuclease of OLD family
MSHIKDITIQNYRGIKNLYQDFGNEKFVVLIGRGDSGKSTILSAIHAVLSPSWNLSFTDLDFHNQDTNSPIIIEVTIKELPKEFLKENKYGLYLLNDLNTKDEISDYYIKICLTVDETLEPHWFVKARPESSLEDKPISATDRALLAVNYITDYTDNQFSYNRQSPLYALTKAKIGDGTTIERIKSSLLRSMTAEVEQDSHFTPLNTPLTDLKKTATLLGLDINELKAQIDIKENPYTGNSIALHNGILPYRLQGKGSKRLMSIAIQSELTKQGGIVLVDELEQGLEPDRIVTLVRILKTVEYGQVFVSTHSVNVTIEVAWHNLFVMNKGATQLQQVSQDLDACRRTNPQALFAKKVICCEGKTEFGFIRGIDTWLRKNNMPPFSSKGIVSVDANGGDKMYTYAICLKQLGIDSCVFADDDKPDELSEKKKDAIALEIPLYLCERGLCLEAQVLKDIPWNKMAEVLACNQEEFPTQSINISDDLNSRIIQAMDDVSQKKMRNEITQLAVSKKHPWFKHIPGGEFLACIVMDSIDVIHHESVLKKNIQELTR